MILAEHPTVQRFRDTNRPGTAEPPKPLDAAWLRQLCLDCGADDAGLVEISRPALDNQRDEILRVFPPTKMLLSFVCRMNREPIRSPARSVANLEFHHTGDHVNEVARKVVATLEKQGIRALNPAMGFPMEMDRFPGGKIWVVSHKPVAVAAGLGHMGIHRNVIHHGALLRLTGQKRKAVQYVVGNPLFAFQMTQHDIRASLYAPLRVLIYEDERGRTCLEYDKPSSLFGQFNDAGIAPVASMLDRKLEDLVTTVIR